ncbi:MAG: hypothetical protein OHK0039_20690 [Bacteroidia bacterium]
MTPPQRQAHRIVWSVLALLLTLGYAAMLWLRPAPVSQPPVAATPQPATLRLDSAGTPGIALVLHQRDTLRQIELTLTAPLPLAAPGLWLAPAEGTPPAEAWLLGVPATAGTYRYDLDPAQSRQTAYYLRIADAQPGPDSTGAYFQTTLHP